MQKENQESEVVFLNVEIKLKIGSTTFVVKSFYDDVGNEDLVAKVKRLLKYKIHQMASNRA